VAADGKSARGSRHGRSPAAHLLDPFDLSGMVTADALHTQRDHAVFLIEVKKAHYVFTVKKNRPALHERLRTLPWERARTKFYDRSQGPRPPGNPGRSDAHRRRPGLPARRAGREDHPASHQPEDHASGPARPST
jgi:hypothetical protein